MTPTPELSLSTLAPGPTDRALFVGMTGSGKTTLARRLLAPWQYVVAIDGKSTLHWPGWSRQTSIERAVKLNPATNPRIIVAPSHAELQDGPSLSLLFTWLYERRNTLVYIDEIYSIASGSSADSIPDSLLAILTRGRERRTPLWGATQRPMFIPTVFLSEAEHAYLFRLQAPQDRKKVGDFYGIEPELLNGLAKRRFYYKSEKEYAVGPLELKLRNGRGSDAVAATP